MWAAGGLPFEIRTTAPSDFIIAAGGSGGYILPSRDLVVNDMEIAVEGAQLDGMICLSSCDKRTRAARTPCSSSSSRCSTRAP
ncbi:MAG TPA: dihydroxy-acid dehydratase [Solirubrobacteraceae bacterium]